MEVIQFKDAFLHKPICGSFPNWEFRPKNVCLGSETLVIDFCWLGANAGYLIYILVSMV